MKIEFQGHSCFLITTAAGTRVVTDPFDPAGFRYRAFDGSAEAVTVSHGHNDHAAAGLVSGSPTVIRGSGRSAVRDVEFLGVATFHDSAGGARRGANTVFVIAADGIRVAHMGDLGHVLTADQVAQIGAVDVALVPVGGYYTIDAADAQKVADQLRARIVIPMHFSNAKCDFPITGVEEFTEGKPNVKQPGGSVLEVSSESLPPEPEIVVLEPSL
jgi:L-ascorbate metabolism protein UlaG (beta-lactamase superfamily)